MFRSYMTVLALFVFAVSVSASALAQYYPYYNGDNVGGVLVNADGMLSQASTADNKKVASARAKALQPIEAGLEESGTRRISLAKLSETVAACEAAGKKKTWFSS